MRRSTSSGAHLDVQGGMTSPSRRPQHVASYPSESLSVPHGGGYSTNNNGRQMPFAGELEPLEVAQLHAKFFIKGLIEANNFENVLDAMATSKTMQANFVKNSVLQIVLLLSAIVFDHILLPSVRGTSTLRVLFQIFWLWPITVASFLVSGVGNLRTAAAHPQSASVSYHARSLSVFIHDQSRASASAVDYRGLTARMIEESYRVLLLANYVAVVTILRRLPVPGIGIGLAFVYSAMVNSYYLWESRWTEQGLTLKDRVKSLEQRYSYHFGFGLVITLASFWHANFFFNLALFSLLFPFFLINSSSPSCHPVPLSPRYPLSTSHTPSSPGVDPSSSRAALRSPPYVPTRIPLLAPAATVHSFLVKVLSPSSGAGRAAGRVRQSRKKDREMEEMEGGGPNDDAVGAASAVGAGGFGYGGVGAGFETSPYAQATGPPPPTTTDPSNGSAYAPSQPSVLAPPPPLGVDGEEPKPQASLVVPPPPPTVRKRAKAE